MPKDDIDVHDAAEVAERDSSFSFCNVICGWMLQLCFASIIPSNVTLDIVMLNFVATDSLRGLHHYVRYGSTCFPKTTENNEAQYMVILCLVLGSLRCMRYVTCPKGILIKVYGIKIH